MNGVAFPKQKCCGLNDPDRVEDSIDNRCNAYKSLDGRLLKVTYAAEQDDVVVITVIEKEEV